MQIKRLVSIKDACKYLQHVKDQNEVWVRTLRKEVKNNAIRFTVDSDPRSEQERETLEYIKDNDNSATHDFLKMTKLANDY